MRGSNVITPFLICAGLFIANRSDAAAAAPPVISQLVSVEHALINEFGHIMKGTDPGADYFGIPVVEGALVHVYQSPGGVVYPPDVHGQADTRNQLIWKTRIGIGASVKAAQPGTFSTVISPRPSGGAKIFVRVFNGATVETSSFYQDSQLFTVSWAVNENFIAAFAAGSQPLDEADDDGDGLNNSWERSYGTDPNVADSDGDGLTDLEEIIAGTDPTRADSAFVLADLLPLPPDQVRLTWQSEAGRLYTLEGKDGLDDEVPFEILRVLFGNGAEMEAVVSGGTDGSAFYRIRVELLPDSE